MDTHVIYSGLGVITGILATLLVRSPCAPCQLACGNLACGGVTSEIAPSVTRPWLSWADCALAVAGAVGVGSWILLCQWARPQIRHDAAVEDVVLQPPRARAGRRQRSLVA